MKAEITGWHDLAVPRRWIAVGAAVIVLVGGAAMLIGRELFSPEPPPPQAAPTKPSATEPSGFERFRDASAELSISHPSSWRRVPASDAQVRLLAEGEGVSLLVRTASLGVDVDAGSLGAARRLTDKLLKAGTGKVKRLAPPRLVALGGLPGYLYLYTLPDPTTGQQAAQAHYFLFRGRTMITVIFRAVPADRFTSLSQLFDQIGGTLRIGQG